MANSNSTPVDILIGTVDNANTASVDRGATVDQDLESVGVPISSILVSTVDSEYEK